MHHNEQKCQFSKNEFNILGTIINGNSIKPHKQKLEIIEGFQKPSNTAQVTAFLGLVEFYDKYISQLATIKEPLVRLTRNNQCFWGTGATKSFEELKTALKNSVLTTFDPSFPTVLKCDASPVGLGAVMQQNDRPVMFISKTLSIAERHYSQIECEALSIVWAIKRLHKFLYRKTFTLVTDNKPIHFFT